MSSPAPDRKALEELWKRRLDDEKLRLEFTRSYLKEVVQDASVTETSDSHFAYRRAIRAEDSAVREYARVLRIYTDLTERGIIPDEAEWLRAQNHDK